MVTPVRLLGQLLANFYWGKFANMRVRLSSVLLVFREVEHKELEE